MLQDFFQINLHGNCRNFGVSSLWSSAKERGEPWVVGDAIGELRFEDGEHRG